MSALSDPSTSTRSNMLSNLVKLRWQKLVQSRPSPGVFTLASVVTLAGVFYWAGIASDRYVSQAHIIIQRTDLAGGQSIDFSSILSGQGGANRADQMLLRDYLLSVDMLKKLDAQLKLRAHYSDTRRDIVSRMWRISPSVEWLHRHYLSRVSVEFDDYAGVLMLSTQGYTPETAHAIAAMMVAEGEQFMDNMARKLATEQVSFLEKQVEKNADKAMRARQELLSYQNRKGLASPQATAENFTIIINKLEAQRTELQTQRNALQAYLVATHPNVVQLNQQLDAINRQIATEKAKLAAPDGKTLNRTVEEFQRLQLQAEFQQQVYQTALTALETGRVEATRTLKKVSVLQAPTLPEYPLEPRRIYNSIVFALCAFLLAGVLKLLVAVIKDHRD